VLVCVDGSRWAYLALQHAGRRLDASDEVILLTVCPRAGAGYIESGRMALEAAERICAPMVAGSALRSRLMVGDPRVEIPRAVSEEGAEVVVMGALGGNGLPHGPSLGDTTRAIWEQCGRPLLVGSPQGVELLTGDETILVASRQEAALRRSVAAAGPSVAAARRAGAARGLVDWFAPIGGLDSRRAVLDCDVVHSDDVAELTAA
jgi:nucleotide-binding universal stress UspA family protein